MFKFNCEENKMTVKIEGLWSIVDTVLTLEDLRKDFRPSKAVINKIAMQMQLPDHPFDFWDRKLILEIRVRQVNRLQLMPERRPCKGSVHSCLC